MHKLIQRPVHSGTFRQEYGKNPTAQKYQYWINSKNPKTPDDWFQSAKEQPGSWWPHWQKWIADYTGTKVAARDPAKGKLKPIEDAPGSYVKTKAN
jgi:polyhydroxyalkanoate synthase